MSNSYKNQEIVELSEREQCRLKLPIFFGDRSNLLHSVRETILNARDEILNNFDKGTIYVKLHDDCETIEILDTGRGINLQGETNGTPNYFLLLEKLWAGGNHNNLELGIASTGTNSVGLTCTNYCAKLFEATSYKNNKYFKASYRDGGMLLGIEEGVDNDIKHGTRIKFRQDGEVYTATVFNPDDIFSICNKLASTSDKIVYIFEHKGETTRFNYTSQEDYLEQTVTNKTSALYQFPLKNYENSVVVDGRDFIEKDTITLNLSTSTEPLIETFLNGTHLIEGGSIEDGITDGLKKVFQKQISNKGKAINKITNQDVQMSFNIHCIFTSTNPSFSGQTKFSSASQLYRKVATDYVVDNMEIFKHENPKEFDKMLEHIKTINSLNTKNEASRSKIKKELSERGNSLLTRPEKLVPCRSKDPKVVKLALLEGDSALNIAKLARNADTTMILPLKGKPINALKCTLDKLIDNQEVVDIYKILGCGMTYKGKNIKGFDKFDLNNLQVSTIQIICDEDDDGKHLATLVVGIFYILSPQLIENGHVEIIQTPLYIIRTKEKEYYAYSEQDRVDIISALTVPYKETRYKGIGGLPVEVMNMCLNDDTKRSVVLTMNDAKKCAEIMELFLSDNIEPRKNYITLHGDKYVSDNIYV